MNQHRINELLDLLKSDWLQDSDLNLLEFITKLSQEAGYKDDLAKLTDDVLIYHLKMRNSDSKEQIPGLKKDHEEDFKTAILKARGIIS
ncbi:YihD family protein [Vibrio marisflavi]|uniref:Protein YihD n=1 Tax=Vibrio marisflavi CECT 7928 TaxID=634439 RepID=A0ABN8EA59_9VIBR|nr:YihD family protein [Vibrio marisflavi]CAH0541915.1 Protein YihD [Vibrio marisflavi CECT 7928]